MKLEELQDLWTKDCQIDRTELGEESLRVSQLHSKYFKFFSAERLTLKKLEKDYKVLYRHKFEYYNGSISQEILREFGWEPNGLKILKSDAHIYLDSDKDLIELSLKMDYQKEKIDFLENIIKSVNNRGYQLKSAIDWEKFKVGA
jgi:hypothetical protein